MTAMAGSHAALKRAQIFYGQTGGCLALHRTRRATVVPTERQESAEGEEASRGALSQSELMTRRASRGRRGGC